MVEVVVPLVAVCLDDATDDVFCCVEVVVVWDAMVVVSAAVVVANAVVVRGADPGVGLLNGRFVGFAEGAFNQNQKEYKIHR